MVDNATWTTKLTFDEEQTFGTTFDEEQTFETTYDEVVKVMSSDHTKLINRDVPDQHPILAITNLTPELGARPSTALSNQDILNILTT